MKRFALPSLLLVFGLRASASIILVTYAGVLKDQNDAALPAGTMLQLVNLGANGAFDPINVLDGSAGPTTQWASGDDSILNVSYLTSFGAGDFASTAAFDLRAGVDSEPGIMDRIFELQEGAVPFGAKIGL